MYEQRGGGRPWDRDPRVSQAAWTRAPTVAPRLTRPHPRDRSRWHWLLAVPVVVPLLTPLYNRIQPRLFGLPFSALNLAATDSPAGQ